MIKTITDTVVEEKKFTEEALKILKSLGHFTFGHTQERLESMMNKEGYTKGYDGTWIMPDDIKLDEDPRA